MNQDNLFTIDNLDPNTNKLSHKMRQLMKKHLPTPHDPEVTPELKIPPPKKKTDFDYDFVYYNQRAGIVKLAGCFNGWQPT